MVKARVQGLKDFLKRSGIVRRMLDADAYSALRHRLILLTSDRQPTRTYTLFWRLPTQFEALVGPVFRFLRLAEQPKPLTIAVIGCSTGAEAYSIAAAIRMRRPEVEFTVKAYDNNPLMLERAGEARYIPGEVEEHSGVEEELIGLTFIAGEGTYTVKKEIAERVQVCFGDILDPGFTAVAARSDIVFAQNLLLNMRPSAAARAFRNVCLLLRPRAVLFIDGMDLGMRQRLTRRHGLVPLDFKIKEIHEEARRVRSGGWHWHYWGLEPFSDARRGWMRRYSTIFLKGEDHPFHSTHTD